MVISKELAFNYFKHVPQKEIYFTSRPGYMSVCVSVCAFTVASVFCSVLFCSILFPQICADRTHKVDSMTYSWVVT